MPSEAWARLRFICLGRLRAATHVLFVDYDPARRFSLIDLVGIKQFLEEKMSAEIDITTRDSLHPMLKADIERSAVRIF
ncbi:hypothetical protein [Mesorhizobium sp. B2-4-16]|uniref:hypothetical protein n=1 Tax=unclassified Mesorhizobium TaxID=325217 RepID=UPI0032B1FCC8